jgi:hypothetical protein
MAWEPQRRKWDWRKFLTTDERAVIERADKAREKIAQLQMAYEEAFGREVQLISNRAIHRAKHDAR